MQKQSVLDYLAKHSIPYELFEHPAVFTCEEAEIHCKHVPGLALKNLFLKSDNGQLYLYILPAHVKANLKELQTFLGIKKLSFGSPELLMDVLKLTPGSVSPFGLINDIEKRVKVILHKEVIVAPLVNFHPNINTASLALTKAAFERYLALTGHDSCVY